MKELALAIPNSLNDVVDSIQRLRIRGVIPQVGGRVLEMLCISGWEDGFVELDRVLLARTLGVSASDIARALAELERLRFVGQRPMMRDRS